MKCNRLKWFGFLLILAVLNMSCAGTKITPQYIDDAYNGKVSNFLVIALIGSPAHQRNFENKVVSQLHSIGVDAVSSAEVMEMPSDLVLTKEMIVNAIQQHRNDAVIISQLIGKEAKDLYRPGAANLGYYQYYSAGLYRLLGKDSKISTSTKVWLETELFDVKTEKLIWSGISETLAHDPLQGEITSDVVKALVDELKKSRLISD